MNKRELIEMLNEFPDDCEIFIGTSCSSDIALNDIHVETKKKFQLTDEIKSVKDGLHDVIIISDKSFDGEYYNITEEDFNNDFIE